ncbi:uncharacterized protein LOC143282998 [Babylonia areolata]|uniref:uncharacterized protein LOC143282998 n=1 Tax=Babylonia areolata TaxID=304850 RepID=UPI003FD2EC54
MEGTQDPNQGYAKEDTSDKTNPDLFAVTATVVVSPAEMEGCAQHFADDNVQLEGNLSNIGRDSPSHSDDDFVMINADDADTQPSLTDTAQDNQPPFTETDIDRQLLLAEAATDEDPSFEEELDTSDHGRLARQLQLVRQEAVGEQGLEQEAACSLRLRNQQDSKGRHDTVMEMQTFQRSSTRRDSFIMAIESAKGGMQTETQMATDGASPDTKGETTDQTDLEESFPDIEELEIFVDKEDSWEVIRRQFHGTRKWVVCGTALLLLGVVTAVILIPQSMVYVEYYQMALARSRLTGRVDRERTLYSGCYLLLPDTELITFRASAHHVHSRMEVTSADGLSLGLQLSLQYFIKGEELGQLHEKLGEQYEEVVKAVIESEVKNSVVALTLDQYRLHRATVERLLYRHLVVRLQGDCCSRHCVNSSKVDSCNNSCSPRPNCTSGLHMTLLPQHVQLGAIDIPAEVNERYLRFTLLQVEAEKETLFQESTLQTKLTERMTRDIRNRAHEVLEEARSASRRTRLESEASAELTRQRAHSQALKQLMTSLNITAADQRHSLLVLLAYRQVKEPIYFPHMDLGLSVLGGA